MLQIIILFMIQSMKQRKKNSEYCSLLNIIKIFYVASISLLLINCNNDLNRDSFDPDYISQSFVIKGNKDTSINTKNGTKLKLDSNCFNSLGEITITIKEYFDIEDIVFNKLSTTTKSSLLETAGMFYISAKNTSNQFLTLDTTLPIQVSNSSIDSSYTIFHGDTIDNTIVWNDDYSYVEITQPFGWTIEQTKNHLRKMYRNRCMNIYKMGWINFDKLFPNEESKLTVQINTKDSIQSLFLKLKQYSVIVESHRDPGSSFIIFNNIPKEMDAKLYCISSNNNGEYYYNLMDINTSQSSIYFPDLIQISKEKLIKLINRDIKK